MLFSTIVKTLYTVRMITLGMDEVGRGAWAGPVVVGAVALSEPIAGLRDSKLLSARQRLALVDTIRVGAHAWSIGSASSEEIDHLGLTTALKLAYQRAATALQDIYEYKAIIIDGSYNFLADSNIGSTVQTIVRADKTVPAVSAASIIAKVWRDQYMIQSATLYPGYGFERHVGYGTAVHQAAVIQQGTCILHRQSVRPIKELAKVLT